MLACVSVNYEYILLLILVTYLRTRSHLATTMCFFCCHVRTPMNYRWFLDKSGNRSEEFELLIIFLFLFLSNLKTCRSAFWLSPVHSAIVPPWKFGTSPETRNRGSLIFRASLHTWEPPAKCIISSFIFHVENKFFTIL